MEGHRGEPRNKPPFPGNYGLWGRPTLMNSVETLADVPVIVQRGADWWTAAGRRGQRRAEVLRRLRPRRAARRLLRADGHHRPGADRAGRRRHRRPGARRGPARRGVVELPRARPAGHAAGLRRPGARPARCSARARWSCWPRAPTCWPRRRTCCGSSATSRAASACRAGSARPRRTRSSATCWPAGGGPDDVDGAHPAARGGHAQDLDLRARPGRAGPGGERARAAGRCHGGPTAAAAGRRQHGLQPRPASAAGVLHRPGRSAEALQPGSGPARRTAVETVPLASALHRVPAAPVTAPARAARFRPLDRGRLRGAGRRHLRGLRRAARLPRPGRGGADGHRARRPRCRPARRWPSRPAACCRTARTRW